MCNRSHLAYEAPRKELRSLRDALFDEIDALRAGTSDPARIDAAVDRAASIIERWEAGR
jgi:hypothetical protein